MLYAELAHPSVSRRADSRAVGVRKLWPHRFEQANRDVDGILLHLIKGRPPVAELLGELNVPSHVSMYYAAYAVKGIIALCLVRPGGRIMSWLMSSTGIESLPEAALEPASETGPPSRWARLFPKSVSVSFPAVIREIRG